jgi:hypothetical protein
MLDPTFVFACRNISMALGKFNSGFVYFLLVSVRGNGVVDSHKRR